MRPTRAVTLGLAGWILALSGPATAQHHDRHDARALAEDPRLAEGQIAPRLEGLGDHHHAVTTRSEDAQFFFDQGLKLTYGFNHQEALRAFKEAARLDPDCAMAYWGWALVLGPNLNLPMQADVVPQAWEAIQMALAKKGGVSQKERDYIDALAVRYAADPEADRAALDAAHATAMRELYEKYPDDLDAATLYAASLMSLSPWNYWTLEGEPRENTPAILAALESVMERDPQHEGALHYYIHAVEAVDPARGEAAADRLDGLAPGAGHLMHMPSHIWMQTGRFKESFEANVQAAKADEGYITQCRAQGFYPVSYYPHNVHFVCWAAVLQGRSVAAIEAARKVAAQVPADMHDNHWGLYETFLSMPLYTLVRFGKWEEILAEPRPPTEAVFFTGMWHWARGTALARTGKVRKARAELAALVAIADDPESTALLVGFSNAGAVLGIARETLAGEIAATAGHTTEAIGHLGRAVLLEDALPYNEPPDWFLPSRHALGAVLLEAGMAVEAEVVYRQDLAKRRENPYALHGLWRSLAAQGRDEEARELEARFRKIWSEADVALVASRF